MLTQMLQSRAGPSSTLGFSPDLPMPYPSLHPSQQGLMQASLPGMGSPSDILRRTINSQLTPMTGGFKEPTQVPFYPKVDHCKDSKSLIVMHAKFHTLSSTF